MLRITFLWDEDAGMSYDNLIENLIGMGAEDIEDEVVTPEPPVKRNPKPKPKKP